jgi:predicted RNA-binding protein (virulence factor B family)
MGEAASNATEVVLLPGAEIPKGTGVGDELDVFLYLDSEDRPVATLASPRVELDQIAFLEVADLHSAGAFFDWGLPKHLLVPHAQQTKPLRIGDRHPIALYLDVSGRLAGTMRVSELLSSKPPFRRDTWVRGEAWRKDPDRGVFVIVERRFVALLPTHEPHELRRGETSRFRVAHVHLDGKVELSLRGLARDEADADVARVLAALDRPDAPRLGDHSPPEEIERVVGLSKKAFKRAIGRLFKARRIVQDDRGYWRVAPQK